MEPDSSPVNLRPATLADAEMIIAMLNNAARWLDSKGVDQWPSPFPDEIVRASVERGDSYVALLEDQPVGSVAVYWDDPGFWGPRPPDAGYIHRLVVDRRMTGQGMGSAILEAAAWLVGAKGRAFLRLDTGARNWRLRRWYEELGFVHRGDIEVEDRGTGPGAGPWPGGLGWEES